MASISMQDDVSLSRLARSFVREMPDGQHLGDKPSQAILAAIDDVRRVVSLGGEILMNHYVMIDERHHQPTCLTCLGGAVLLCRGFINTENVQGLYGQRFRYLKWYDYLTHSSQDCVATRLAIAFDKLRAGKPTKLLQLYGLKQPEIDYILHDCADEIAALNFQIGEGVLMPFRVDALCSALKAFADRLEGLGH